jgi:coenzyme PQQ biosynthesis protein PqqD
VTERSSKTLLAPNERPRLREGVRLHPDRLTGRPLLLFPEGILQLNAAASSVLNLCDGHRTVDEIAGSLATIFEASHDQLFADIAGCLLDLRARQLLRFSSDEVT